MTYLVKGLEEGNTAFNLFEGKYVVGSYVAGDENLNRNVLRIRHALRSDEPRRWGHWCAIAGWTIEKIYLIPIGDNEPHEIL